MKKLLIAAAALTLAPAAALADSAPAASTPAAASPAAATHGGDESGAWKVNADFGGAITYTITCTLKQDATGAITGPCTDPQGGADSQVKGTATATNVEFAYDTTYQGSPIHLDYKGDIQADGSLKGTIDAGGPQGTFTATR